MPWELVGGSIGVALGLLRRLLWGVLSRTGKSGTRHKWRNFILTASYRPAMDQLTASLYRDGHLQFEGKHLRLGDRVALQGIFNKALPRTRPVNIFNKGIAEHDRLQDLTVSQFVVRDTWIGVAIGPRKTAEPHVAKRRKNRIE